jgi:hypothetical protein
MATKYLTKWAKAKVIKVNDAKAMIIFLYDNVITQFNYSKFLINDKSKHFLNEVIKSMANLVQINHCKTILYHLQTNGQT